MHYINRNIVFIFILSILLTNDGSELFPVNNIININDRDHNMRSLIMIGAIYSSFKCIDYLKYKKADLYLEDKYDNN